MYIKYMQLVDIDGYGFKGVSVTNIMWPIKRDTY